MAVLQLPKKKTDLNDVLEKARTAAWSSRNAFLLWSQVAYYYLQGYRRFNVESITDAKLQVGFETGLGDLRFRNEDIRKKYKTALGLFMRMDISPVIKRRKWGLNSLRQASTAQVVLDAATSHMDLNSKKMEFFQFMLLYGTAGLGHSVYTLPNGKPAHEIEVIPPWELIPIPAYPTSAASLQGVMRCRWVPLTFVLEKARTEEHRHGLQLPGKNDKQYRTKLRIIKVEVGSTPPDSIWNTGGGSLPVGFETQSDVDDIATAGGGSSKPEEDYVPLCETWIYGPEDTCARYVVQVGKHIAFDMNFEEQEGTSSRMPFPISIARFVPDTGFWSYGFVGMLMSGNHQIEKMLQNLYRNVEELDAYGTLMWPQTAGAGINEFNKKNGRPKIVAYEPDYTVPDAKPYPITPTNTGDFPGRVVMMGSQFQDKISDQGPLMSGQPVGRLESGSALGFTFEVSQIAHAATAHQIANSWSQIYKSILANERLLRDKGDKLELTNIDDNVAGVALTDDGQLKLDKNPIPDYWKVKIDIRDRQPSSREARKQELLTMFQMQLVDPLGFSIINYREDLGFPLDDTQKIESYRKAVYHNILLFNDGETPGEVHPNLIADDPMIHLRAVTAFTSRLEFAMAKPAVKNAFADLIKLLQSLIGQFPSQLPPMEALAEMGLAGAPPQGAGGPPQPQGPVMGQQMAQGDALGTLT